MCIYIYTYTYISPVPRSPHPSPNPQWYGPHPKPSICTLFAAFESHNLLTGPCLAVNV